MVRRVRKKWFRKKKSKSPKKEKEPKLIMDVIEEEYPDKSSFLKTSLEQIGKLFTEDEWLSILTKSRSSHEQILKEKRGFENDKP